MDYEGAALPKLREGAAVLELREGAAAIVRTTDGRLCVDDRVEGRNLQVLHKSFVKPSPPTPSEKRWLPCNKLDDFWLPFYTPVLCVYREHPGRRAVGEQLRQSLARALATFYPLAGRVVTSSGEAPGIACDDTGAVFVEACIDAELDDLQCEDGFQPSFVLSGMAEAGLGEYPKLRDDPAGRPALVVQVTHFQCGGVTLALNWAHAVADGFSGFHFLKSWTELARGQEIALDPVHDRALAKPREPLVLSDPFSESYSAEFSNIQPGLSARHSSTASATDSEPERTAVVVQVVEITKQLIDGLKREAESGAPSQTRLSRACIVSAHLWRALTKARGLPGTDLVRMWTLVEGRKTCSLPAGYFGNVVGSPFTTTTVDILTKRPLAYSAGLIDASIKHATKEWYQDLVDWLEAKQYTPLPEQVLEAGHECSTSWQTRFPYYEMDFGFGPPVKSMRNACAAWDGNLVLLPSSRSPDNFTAMIHTRADVMARFLPLLRQCSQDAAWAGACSRRHVTSVAKCCGSKLGCGSKLVVDGTSKFRRG